MTADTNAEAISKDTEIDQRHAGYIIATLYSCFIRTHIDLLHYSLSIHCHNIIVQLAFCQALLN